MIRSVRKRWTAQILILVLLLPAALLDLRIALPRSHFDGLFVFDITQSMMVNDVWVDGQRHSRLEMAKEAVRQYLQQLPCGSRIAFAIFTAHRSLLLFDPVELCAHRLELMTILADINWPLAWEARSEIAKGVFSALLLAAQLPSPPTVVFFTDGHEAPPLLVGLAPRFDAPQKRGDGLLIGIGGNRLQPIPKFDKNGEQEGFWSAAEVSQKSQPHLADVKTDSNGPEHLSALRSSYLQGLAKRTDMAFFVGTSVSAITDQLQQRKWARIRPRTSNLDILPAVLAGLLLLFLWWPQWRPTKKRPTA